MKLFTAKINYNGPSKVDITIKSSPPEYRMFAPSWDLVMKFKNKIINWPEYEGLYRELMEESWGKNRQEWITFLKRENAVLCCYCTGKKCHRFLLVDILKEKGLELGINVEYIKELT